MIQPDIYLTEINLMKETHQMVIPWLPETVHFASNEARFASYDILDKGEIKVPTGANIHSYSWEGILPGEGHRDTPLQRGEWQDPKKIQGVWSFWREYGVPLRLLIIGTPVNHDVYLEDYEVDYTGAFGDYRYSISFIEARDIATTNDPAASTSFAGTPGAKLAKDAERVATRGGVPAVEAYTSVAGDTLWSIAQRFLGDGSRWEKIYLDNEWIIETVAKNNGLQSSEHGLKLMPGTWLEIRR